MNRTDNIPANFSFQPLTLQKGHFHTLMGKAIRIQTHSPTLIQIHISIPPPTNHANRILTQALQHIQALMNLSNWVTKSKYFNLMQIIFVNHFHLHNNRDFSRGLNLIDLNRNFSRIRNHNLNHLLVIIQNLKNVLKLVLSLVSNQKKNKENKRISHNSQDNLK